MNYYALFPFLLLFSFPVHYSVASFCGKSGVPYSFEVLSSGAPVLGCAQPSCVITATDAEGDTLDEDSQFFTNTDGQSDGFFRDGDRALKRFRHTKAPKMIANCSGQFSELSCPRKNQWVGGIEYIDHPRQPLVLQCCTFEGLRFSQEVGSTTIGPGEAITGGEVVRGGRQISFDVIANVRKVSRAEGDSSPSGKIQYEVTVRRMNCLPDPPEPEVEFDGDVPSEINKVLGSAKNKELSGGKNGVAKTKQQQQQQASPKPPKEQQKGRKEAKQLAKTAATNKTTTKGQQLPPQPLPEVSGGEGDRAVNNNNALGTIAPLPQLPQVQQQQQPGIPQQLQQVQQVVQQPQQQQFQPFTGQQPQQQQFQPPFNVQQPQQVVQQPQQSQQFVGPQQNNNNIGQQQQQFVETNNQQQLQPQQPQLFVPQQQQFVAPQQQQQLQQQGSFSSDQNFQQPQQFVGQQQPQQQQQQQFLSSGGDNNNNIIAVSSTTTPHPLFGMMSLGPHTFPTLPPHTFPTLPPHHHPFPTLPPHSFPTLPPHTFPTFAPHAAFLAHHHTPAPPGAFGGTAGGGGVGPHLRAVRQSGLFPPPTLQQLAIASHHQQQQQPNNNNNGALGAGAGGGTGTAGVAPGGGGNTNPAGGAGGMPGMPALPPFMNMPKMAPAMGTILASMQGERRPIMHPVLGLIGYSNAPQQMQGKKRK